MVRNASCRRVLSLSQNLPQSLLLISFITLQKCLVFGLTATALSLVRYGNAAFLRSRFFSVILPKGDKHLWWIQLKR